MSDDRSNVVAGIQAVIAALKVNPGSIRCLHLASEAQNQRVQDIRLLASDLGIDVRSAPREVLDQLAGIERHQDVAAELYQRSAMGEEDLENLLAGIESQPLLLILDGVQDPHNLGACLRTAEAAGVNAVIIPKDRASGLTPAARKVSAGASEIIPVVQVTNLARVLRKLKEQGLWLCGTSEQAPQDIYQQDLKGPLVLVMGSEGKGLRRLTAELCDFLVSIPMAGQIESLNVSVATGVCLFEIQRQRAAG